MRPKPVIAVAAAGLMPIGPAEDCERLIRKGINKEEC